ncbi:MAG: cysteine hydrolase [Solirubrobacterales bacterium]|nr:cysteine hydrolase [Solirubrobacterales bacterium]MCB0861385.1 cysteine hydrolase [Solirubrobacterales bacterium]HRV60763.1 isochorismatase family cysteine hydrolase [Solirubrobacterales bacterium]
MYAAQSLPGPLEVSAAAPLPEGSRTALLVVDMQNDFVEEGAPRQVHGALEIVPAIASAVERMRIQGDLIVWTCRAYSADGSNVEAARKPGFKKNPHTVAGTRGAEIVDGLTPWPNDLNVTTPSYSAFFRTDLDLKLREAGVSKIVGCGVDLSRCVRATLVEAISLGYECSVLAPAVASRDDQALNQNLADLADLDITVEE